ncbi:thermostable hemolysin [Microbulbifer variabilis]|uniref:thermostable hemolysin n=1 Tax=Microbulbifer variabilis TaxID=266805 RepID=UPI001CFD120A|nr:thermostable hemolysin [Microbulbifer variabilis]
MALQRHHQFPNQSAPSKHRSRRHKLDFDLTRMGQAGHSRVQGFIAQKFADTYGARVNQFAPLLLSAWQENAFSSALGLRRADSGPLFLEQYLDQPVEKEIAAFSGRPVERAQIVEIGNLVSTSRGGSQMLFLMLFELFAAAGVHWAIYTATAEVRGLLQKLVGRQTVLCEADGRRLGSNLGDWGRYYEAAPAVTAIDVSGEHRALLQNPLMRERLKGCRGRAQFMSPVLKTPTEGAIVCN